MKKKGKVLGQNMVFSMSMILVTQTNWILPKIATVYFRYFRTLKITNFCSLLG